MYADLIIDFLNYREKCGLKNIHNEFQYFRKLDKFIVEEAIGNIFFR